MIEERVYPADVRAEAFVLGACLLDGDAIDVAIDMLVPMDFSSERHQLLFEAVATVHGNRQPVDPVTLGVALGKRGGLQAIGGVRYLGRLQDVVPTIHSITTHATRVKEVSRRRAYMVAAEAILDHGFNEDVTDEDFFKVSDYHLASLQDRERDATVENIGVTVTHLASELCKRYDDHRNRSEDFGVMTGISHLDYMTTGLQHGELTVIAGATSSGKTALAMSFARNAAVPVLLFSMEQPRRQLAYRLLAAETSVSIQSIRRLKDWGRDAARKIRAIGNLELTPKWRIYVDDRSFLTTIQIAATARRQVRENGVGLVIVDYMGLVRPVSTGKNVTREREMATISADLKALAMELKIPVVALSQLNRAYASREDKRPRVEDLRDSGSIGQDADLVIMPYRKQQQGHPSDKSPTIDGKQDAEILVTKNRNGPTGAVLVWWDGARMLFSDRDEGEPVPTDDVDDEESTQETTMIPTDAADRTADTHGHDELPF